jgi:hypothetical protein
LNTPLDTLEKRLTTARKNVDTSSRKFIKELEGHIKNARKSLQGLGKQLEKAVQDGRPSRSPARKTTARKTTARKSTARKSTARRAGTARSTSSRSRSTSARGRSTARGRSSSRATARKR